MSDNFKVEMNPLLFVAEHVELSGGIYYYRESVGISKEEKTLTREWKTKVIIQDEDERDLALNTRTKIYQKIRTVCASTKLGLFCSVEDREQLEKLLEEIQKITKEFNNESTTCKLASHYAFFNVGQSFEKVASTLASQVADISEDIAIYAGADDNTVLELAPKRLLGKLTIEQAQTLPSELKWPLVAKIKAFLIRDAVSPLRDMKPLFVGESEKVVSSTIDAAKTIARGFVKSSKKGPTTLDVTDDLGIIENARALFITAGSSTDVEISTVEPLASVMERDIDIELSTPTSTTEAAELAPVDPVEEGADKESEDEEGMISHRVCKQCGEKVYVLKFYAHLKEHNPEVVAKDLSWEEILSYYD